MYDMVFWDFGGVITASPFQALSRYEAERGIPAGFIREVNSQNPNGNAWALIERNDISLTEFDTLFGEESKALGHHIPGADLLPLIAMPLVPTTLQLMQRVSQHIPCAGITNNMAAGFGPTMQLTEEAAQAHLEALSPLKAIFESWRLGVRKPEPAIFEHACAEMKVDPSRCIFLDDLGINLKPARAMGMTTIKVTSPDQAVQELSVLLDLPLLANT